jgi:hypothetical protein
MPRVARASLFLALTLCAIAATSCGDPFTIRPPSVSATDSFSIRALTRTPASARALWRMGSFQRFRLDSIGAPFDLGLDIDAAGKVVVYPARTIATPPPGGPAGTVPPTVGLLVGTQSYVATDRAPETGYRADTAVTVAVGTTVLVRSTSTYCNTQPTGGTLLYAKFVVDSINTTNRELFVRSTIQLSCNFRSFAAGVPEF